MSDGFDIDFKLLPPKLQMQLWVLALDADTGKVNIAYRTGTFQTSLAYNYGGNLEASLALPRLTATMGVNPANGDVNLGVAFRGFKFGTTASFAKPSAGLSLSYGAGLLPLPLELADTFRLAGGAAGTMAADIAAAPNNPLAWYQTHSNDVSAITKAVGLGQQIDKFGQDKSRFGAALRLNYGSETGLMIYGGAQLRF